MHHFRDQEYPLWLSRMQITWLGEPSHVTIVAQSEKLILECGPKMAAGHPVEDFGQ